MKAAVWYGERDIRIEERETKELQPNDVKVKVAWAGICGSDLHAYLHPDSVPMNKNMVIGHEFSGEIAEVGSQVTKFKEGDRVCIYPMMLKDPSNAETERFITLDAVGAQIDGGFAEYAILPQKTIFKIPDTLPLEVAAMVEPAAVSFQSIKDSNVEEGDTVVVYGAGPIGLFAVLGAKAAGASNIIVVDLFDSRLGKATEVGATHTFNAKEVNPVEEIRKLFPDGADVTIEAAGVDSTFNQAIQSTKVRGTMMVISFHTQDIQFNAPASLLFSGVKLMGSVGYSNETYNEVIQLLANGRLPAQSIITSKVDIDNIAEEGFEALIHDKSQAKILVKLSGAY
ncbi:butanediol dehydrogenase [Bacillus thuringiensis serovar brasilensis]|nr:MULTISPECIES: 2,3-butanediol dehydrogenase [Bacillus cereus group]MRA73659.1 zinc-binding dehydrogenase [Bacillus thuringiensis]MCU5028248.1 2,3-butanediol dehydrogenase [Bacillus cereus]MRC54364.1 zinc-binding dehydrogenase [Bacillus thuringiensis]OTX35065.1 butanediol dehydrogenase [Bacillus thuringiensis serovar brasilensis]QKE06040.1 2,3-butanediol dehydrogenase [Bacillus cereus]